VIELDDFASGIAARNCAGKSPQCRASRAIRAEKAKCSSADYLSRPLARPLLAQARALRADSDLFRGEVSSRMRLRSSPLCSPLSMSTCASSCAKTNPGIASRGGDPRRVGDLGARAAVAAADRLGIERRTGARVAHQYTAGRGTGKALASSRR